MVGYYSNLNMYLKEQKVVRFNMICKIATINIEGKK